MDHLILTPAYGRDYKTAAAVRADWEAGKDFLIQNIAGPFGRWAGKPCSIRDFTPTGVTGGPVPEGSYIRYNHKTELTHIGVWQEAEHAEVDAEAAESIDDLLGNL